MGPYSVCRNDSTIDRIENREIAIDRLITEIIRTNDPKANQWDVYNSSDLSELHVIAIHCDDKGNVIAIDAKEFNGTEFRFLPNTYRPIFRRKI